MEYVKNIFSFLGISFLIILITLPLKSGYISKYLSDNLIFLLVTLLAINTATSGLIISKLQELAKEQKSEFDKTYKSLKHH